MRDPRLVVQDRTRGCRVVKVWHVLPCFRSCGGRSHGGLFVIPSASPMNRIHSDHGAWVAGGTGSDAPFDPDILDLPVVNLELAEQRKISVLSAGYSCASSM